MSGGNILLGTDDVGNNHGGYETLSSNADRHSPDNTAEVGGQKVDKNTVFSANFSTMCNMVCPWCLDIYFHRPNDTDPTSYAGFTRGISWRA